MEMLRDYTHHYVPLSEEAMTDLEEAFRVKKHEKGDILFREGEYCQNLYFILDGTCRTFHNQDERELTTWIYPEGYFVTSWASFITQNPSKESIQVLEPSTVASISRESLERLYNKHPLIERFGRKLAEEQLAWLDDYSRGYQFKTAKKKYEALLKFFPDVTQRVNLGYIASMLGITQETLSRIRRQVSIPEA